MQACWSTLIMFIPWCITIRQNPKPVYYSEPSKTFLFTVQQTMNRDSLLLLWGCLNLTPLFNMTTPIEKSRWAILTNFAYLKLWMNIIPVSFGEYSELLLNTQMRFDGIRFTASYTNGFCLIYLWPGELLAFVHRSLTSADNKRSGDHYKPRDSKRRVIIRN